MLLGYEMDQAAPPRPKTSRPPAQVDGSAEALSRLERFRV